MNVGDLIKRASVMAGLTDPNQDMEGAQITLGFQWLNDMVDIWKTKRLAIFLRQRTGPFDVSFTQEYTIGPGATWNTQRPLWIDRAGVIYTQGSDPFSELPIHIFTVKEWAQVQVKSITSTLPRSLYYERQYGSTGWGRIFLYPVPSQLSQVVLYVPVAVDEFPVNSDGTPNLLTEISLPPGYRMALISNLAVYLATGIIAIPDAVASIAVSSFADLQTSNVVTHMDQLSCDEATVAANNSSNGIFDWITGNIW